MRADEDFAAHVTLGPPVTQSSTLTLVKFITLGLIIAFGSAGNALVIYAFGRYLKLRRSPYILIVGFVTLDLMRVFLCFPITFITIVHRLQWKYGSQLCQLMAFTNVFCLLGNSLSNFGMAFDRFVDNRYRVLYRRKLKNFLGTAMLMIIWGMAFLFAFPTVYGVRLQREEMLAEAECTFPHHYYPNDVDTLGLMVSLTTILVLTNILYVKLFLFMRDRRKMRPVLYEPAVSENWGFFDQRVGYSVRQRWQANSLSDSPISVINRDSFHHHWPPTNYEVAVWRSMRQRDNEKLTKLCFSIHVIFSAMWLPYIVVCFWFALEFGRPKFSVPEWLEASATWLTYLQVTITPFAFFSLSGFTRKKLQLLNSKRRFSPTLSNSSN